MIELRNMKGVVLYRHDQHEDGLCAAIEEGVDSSEAQFDGQDLGEANFERVQALDRRRDQ